jgi:hypothetical protein
MNLQLDHVFILVESGAQIVDRLLELGFQEGPSNTHPGQGTANRRVYFANGMVEFLWVRDANEANTGPGQDLRLPERSQNPEASPFGAIFVPRHDAKSQACRFPVGIINQPTFHPRRDFSSVPTPRTCWNRSVSISRFMIRESPAPSRPVILKRSVTS